jgi:hypothetical protein
MLHCADEPYRFFAPKPNRLVQSIAAEVNCRHLLLRQLKVGLEQMGDCPMERVRRLRRAVHDIRTDPERLADHEVASTWAIEAMTALRIVSYSGHHLDSPTLDRFAETAQKLPEDIYSRMGTPYSQRCAFVRVAEPISMSAVLESSHALPREAIQAPARRCETSVQEGIDGINQLNPHPGGQLYSA